MGSAISETCATLLVQVSRNLVSCCSTVREMAFQKTELFHMYVVYGTELTVYVYSSSRSASDSLATLGAIGRAAKT